LQKKYNNCSTAVKKGEDNIMIQGIRALRAPFAPFALRRRTVSGRGQVMSGNLVRPVAIVCTIALTVVFTFSQFFHWGIESNQEVLEQLQSVRRDVGSENISLLAVRARLMSAGYVESVAGTELQLYRPEKGQLHRL
jgi:hypothetical protein